MTRILAFDTETTGLNADTTNLLAPTNDAPMSLAAYLFDDETIGHTFTPMMVKPEGVFACYLKGDKEPHPKALEVHGITREKANRLGISPDEALPTFAEFLDSADLIVGHNVKYDMDIMRIAYARAGWEGDPFEGRNVYCTMNAATPICKMFRKRMDHPLDWKPPKLIEAYQFFLGRGFEGAHGAMTDTLACFDVYLVLQGMKAVHATNIESVAKG